MKRIASIVQAAVMVLIVFSPAAGMVPASGGLAPAVFESDRLTRAKELISDDRWLAAIAELRAAAADPKEPNKDEALFWLAHSQNQVGDLAEAVESIRRLQSDFHKSRWSAPAYSLLLELAQKLGRSDVLWRMAPPTPPSPPAPRAVVSPRRPRTGSATAAPHAAPAPPAAPPSASSAPPPAAPEPPVPWVAETFLPDKDLRIQALGRLIHTDANKVIPMLGDIALEDDNTGAARRAVFVLAQSRHPQAQRLVVDLARKGPEPVRVAAVRDLGLFGGPEVAQELLHVYLTANVPVKQQVVMSLGQRSDANALLKIARAETNPQLRETAVIALGRAGAHEQLRALYSAGPRAMRRAVIRALFTARDDEGLIRIAEEEKEPRLRASAREQLRLMGTPRARDYLRESRR